MRAQPAEPSPLQERLQPRPGLSRAERAPTKPAL